LRSPWVGESTVVAARTAPPTGSADRDSQLVQAGAVRTDVGLAVAGAVQGTDRPVARCGVEAERTLLRCLDLTGELAVAVEQADVRATERPIGAVHRARDDHLAVGVRVRIHCCLVGCSATVTHDSTPPYRVPRPRRWAHRRLGFLRVASGLDRHADQRTVLG